MTNRDPVVAVDDAMVPVVLIDRGSVSLVIAEEDNNRIRLPVGCVKVLTPCGVPGWVPAGAFTEEASADLD